MITNVLIYYFSGTGNAKRIALWLVEFARKNKITCSLVNISKSPIPTPTDNAHIFIISPTHGFNYPKITLDFIRRFPKNSHKVALINTRAGMKVGKLITPGLSGITLYLASFLLKLKGYQIVGKISFDMPSNWISIHPALSTQSILYLHHKNYEKLQKHASKLFAGLSDFATNQDILQDILIAPIAILYYVFGRFAFAKSFYANYTCDNCNICIKNCPVKAIKIVDNRPFWTFKCESCMKCMNTCPKQSIETAHGMFLVLSLIGSITSTAIFSYFLQKYHVNNWTSDVIFNLVFFILLIFFYYFQHYLLRFKYINRFISFTSFTHYKFWGRYKSVNKQ